MLFIDEFALQKQTQATCLHMYSIKENASYSSYDIINLR